METPQDSERVEGHPSGNTILAKITEDWEKQCHDYQATNHDTSISYLRLGIVLSKTALAWKKCFYQLKLGVSGPLGSGQQWWSWIHIQDVCSIVKYIIEHKLSGPINCVAPGKRLNKKTLISASHDTFIGPLFYQHQFLDYESYLENSR